MGVQVPLLAPMTMATSWRMGAVVWLLAACGGGAANGAFTPGALPQGGDWTGIYFSDWGRLELQRNGDTVVGTFTSDIKRGRLSGSVHGNILRFTWTQQDDRIIGRPRAMNGSGVFQYYVDDNGEHHLRGTWGYEASIDDGGEWNAAKSRTRLRPRPQPQPTGEEGGGGPGEESSPPAQGGTEPSGEPEHGGDALDNL